MPEALFSFFLILTLWSALRAREVLCVVLILTLWSALRARGEVAVLVARLVRGIEVLQRSFFFGACGSACRNGRYVCAHAEARVELHFPGSLLGVCFYYLCAHSDWKMNRSDSYQLVPCPSHSA